MTKPIVGVEWDEMAVVDMANRYANERFPMSFHERERPIAVYIGRSMASWQFDQLRAEIEALKTKIYTQSIESQREINQLLATNARYKAALADFIEAFEGQYGGDFWNSPLGIKHRALKENE